MDHILGPGDSVVPFSHICGQTPALYGDPGAQPHVSFPQGKSQIGKGPLSSFSTGSLTQTVVKVLGHDNVIYGEIHKETTESLLPYKIW